MTGLSRAEERRQLRRRRQNRRDNLRMVVAGFCVTAGLILFVSVKVDHDSSAATPHAAALTHSTSADPSTSAGAGDSVAPLPIVANGTGDGTGPAAFSNPDVVAAVVAAATSGVEAVDSYNYRNLDSAIAAGLAATTGQFQASYRTAMTGAVASTAPDTQTVQQCTVDKIGITSVSADLSRASVLVFGRLQTTNTATGATPTTSPITLGVTLDHVGSKWLISAVSDFSTASGRAQPPGTRALFNAVVAGATEVENLLTFSRSNYDTDFGRALAGLTGPLLTEQQGLRASILATLNAAHTDYLGEIRCIGIESVSADSVILLVAATSYSVADSGERSVLTLPKLEIGVTRINGVWLVDQFQSIASD